MKEINFEGKLFFYSETGTEGGYWAFQDNKYIALGTTVGGITNDTKVWDIHNRKKSGITSDSQIYLNQEWLPFPNPKRAYTIPIVTRVTVNWDDGTIEYQRKSDTLLIEVWDYKGIHILKNGDKLKILDTTKKTILWDGTIELKSYDLFTEYTDDGLWIHADQKGISREEWYKYFLNNYPAQLQIYKS